MEGDDVILQGDNLLVMPTIPAKHFNTCVTSPPYWGQRDYGIPPSEWPEITYTPMSGLPSITVPAWTGCLGLEPTPEMFVAHTVHVFQEVRRVLRDDGTLWLNYGDSYIGSNKGRWADGTGVIGDKPMQSKARKSGSLLYQNFRVNHLKRKDLAGIPWRVAFALQADGWYLRMDNIWNKSNCMPESVADRPTKAHEYIFLLSKSASYYYDKDAVKEQAVGFNNLPVAGSQGSFGPMQARRRKGNAKSFRGGRVYTGGQSFNNSSSAIRDSHGNSPNETGLRNRRSVWTVATAQCPEAHFATFPEKLIEPCILAGAPVGGHVLDPFGGLGTTRKAALKLGRECTLIEMSPLYVELAKKRTQ